MNEKEFEEFIRRNPQEAMRLIVKAFNEKELLRVGNRSYINAFKYPESRFDLKDLMHNGGSLEVLKNPDMLQPLSDPGKLFTDKYVIPPSSLIFKWADKVYDKKWWGQVAGVLPDAATVIEQAINASPEGVKFLKKGVYNIESLIDIGGKDKLTLIGEGIDVTILKATSAFAGAILYGSSPVNDLTVMDMTIDANGKVDWAVSCSGDRFHFERVKMMNRRTAEANGGLYFQQPSPLHTIPFTYVRDHKFINCVFDGVDGSQTGDAVDFTYVLDLLVQGSIFRNCGANAFDALNCNRAIYRDVISHDNGYGAMIEGGVDFLIDGMVSYNNNGRGLFIATPSYSTVAADAIDRYSGVVISGGHITYYPRRFRVVNSLFYGNTGPYGTGLHVECGAPTYAVISHNIAILNDRFGFRFYGLQYSEVTHNKAINNSQDPVNDADGIAFMNDCSHIICAYNECVDDLNFQPDGSTHTQRYGILTANIAGVDYIDVLYNKLLGNVSGPYIGFQNFNGRVEGNEGYVTENGGTATLPAASTSVVVNHGCDYTPDPEDIDMHPISSLGTASYWWVDTITSTQFTIHVDAAPGVDVDFKWSVRRI